MTLKERFLSTLPQGERQLFEEQLKHESTILTLDGELIHDLNTGRNLFEEVLKCERYIVDGNINWQAFAALPENREIAFIIGKTMADERRNLRGLFFSPKVDIRNNNLFLFGLSNYFPKPAVEIERLDKNIRLTLDEGKLDERSKPLNEVTDAYVIETDKQHMQSVRNERAAVLLLLGVKKISDLAPPEQLIERRNALRSFIQENSPRCLLRWVLSAHIARHCYALLLAEKERARTEFADETNPNIFGDTLVLHNALYLQAKILSEDRFLRRMAKGVGIECVKSDVVRPLC